MHRKITTEDFITRSREIHKNKYSYIYADYKSAKIKVIITCQVHGNFEQTPDAHLHGQGCPKCKFDKLSNLFVSNVQSFTNKANELHNFVYNYSLVNYVNAHQKVMIICNIHGTFKQTPNAHLSGKGCPECVGKGRSNNKRFIKTATTIHGNRYDYSKVNYYHNKIKVIILCPIHGDFLQTPCSHLSGDGCPGCSMDVFDTKTFRKKAEIIHNNKYDYSKAEYIDYKTNIIIICKMHGDFYQSPSNHLRGSGCPSCSHKISIPEQIWLASFNNPNIISHIQLKIGNKKYNVDGFDPTTNTVYEFNGDYWHGNPKIYNTNELNRCNKKTFGQLYEKTKNKENALKNAGYKIISIWESDFKKNEDS